MNEEWWKEFQGKCITCIHAEATNRKQEMMCTLEKAARNHGLPSRPGGAWFGTPVHKLFGCVYYQSAKPENSCTDEGIQEDER